MEKIKKRNKIITNTAAVAVFVISFAVCAVFGWIDVINTLFSADGDNLGELLVMPHTYTVVCFLFLGVLCALVIFGYIYKNKLMLMLAAGYEVLFLLSFVLLGLLSAGSVNNGTLSTIVTYFVSAVLIPVYGVIWNINWLFFVIYIPLLIFNIVAIVKVFKNKK